MTKLKRMGISKESGVKSLMPAGQIAYPVRAIWVSFLSFYS